MKTEAARDSALATVTPWEFAPGASIGEAQPGLRPTSPVDRHSFAQCLGRANPSDARSAGAVSVAQAPSRSAEPSKGCGIYSDRYPTTTAFLKRYNWRGMLDLVHLAVIWSGALLAVVAARATRMTPVVYYLAVGTVFVRLGWLPGESSEFIRGVSDLGIVLIMFALGFEETAGNFMRSVRHSWGIAFFGALGPFVAAYGVADFFWGDAYISLICGLAMTATAVSLTMISLRSEGLHRSRVATRIMTSAVLDDIASLALVAVVVPVITSDVPFEVQSLLLVMAKAIAFFALIWMVGAWILPQGARGPLRVLPRLGRLGMRDALRFGGSEHAVLQLLLFAVACAILGHEFGFHPAIGAYLAGLVLSEEYFFHKEGTGSFEDTRRIVDNIAFSWIGPVFFVSLGTQIQFDLKLVVSLMPEIAAMTIGVMLFQIVSAGLAARFTGGMNRASSIMIGFGMLGRAELAFVVLDIAYVQHSILSEEAFTTLMATCFFLNISVPLTIHVWKPHYQRAL